MRPSKKKGSVGVLASIYRMSIDNTMMLRDEQVLFRPIWRGHSAAGIQLATGKIPVSCRLAETVGSPEHDAQAQVLDYWRAVELFSPQKLPKENPFSRTNPVVRLEISTLLPWELPGLSEVDPDEKVWRYTLYLAYTA